MKISRFFFIAVAAVCLAACSNQPTEKKDGFTCNDEPFPQRRFSVSDDTVFPLGPYLMHTTRQSAVIMWETESECDGKVEFGASADNLDLSAGHEDAAKIHEVTLRDLGPDTRYFYRVASCGTASRVHELYTAPLEGAPLLFSVWGDSRTDFTKAAEVVNAMVTRSPHLNLHVGDVVTSGEVESQWKNEFFDPLRPLGHSVPTYVAIGNHEGNAKYFYSLFSYPQSLPDDPESESFYSFTYGNVFFLVIDTNKLFHDIVVKDKVFESPQSRWIKEQAASEEARAATWRIAAGHEPGYSESWSPGNCEYDGTGAVRDWLFPLLSENRFHAYFTGHTHDYERGIAGGVLQIISGGGGASLDQWCKDFPEIDVQRSAYHYVLVEAGCTTMTLSAHGLDDGEIPFDKVVLDADRWGEIVSSESE